MKQEGVKSFTFGQFTLEATEHRLLKKSREIYLRPKSFETLLYLLEHSGRLVSKDELLKNIWAGIIVSETSLSHCIKEVRSALHDDDRHPHFIKTVPRLGYKFIAQVQKVPATLDIRADRKKNIHKPDPDRNAKTLPAPPENHIPTKRNLKWLALGLLSTVIVIAVSYFTFFNNTGIKSLAVLPFMNLSADEDQEYFVDGMTEALIARLAKIEGLRIISRTSVMQYKGNKKSLPKIADELKVDAVVEGSVVRSGDKVNITAQLIRARKENHLWAENYEREMNDIIALQNELAFAIAKAVKSTLSPTTQQRMTHDNSIDPEAYQAYLKGRYYWEKRMEQGFTKGMDYFQQAIEIDPHFALAYVGLADCHNMLNNYDLESPTQSSPKAKAAAMQALAIDDSLPEAHASLAFTLMHYDWDWNAAEKELRKAIRLNPNYSEAHHWYALFLSMNKRMDQAFDEIQIARSLDPVSLIIKTNEGWLYYFQRHYDRTIDICSTVLKMDENFISAHIKLAWAFEQTGNYEQAIAEIQKNLSILKGDAATTALLGHAYAVAGRKDEALTILAELLDKSNTAYISPYWIACIYAGMGDKDSAFLWLRNAAENRCGWLSWLNVDPKMDPLRGDERFKELLVKVGLQ